MRTCVHETLQPHHRDDREVASKRKSRWTSHTSRGVARRARVAHDDGSTRHQYARPLPEPDHQRQRDGVLLDRGAVKRHRALAKRRHGGGAPPSSRIFRRTSRRAFPGRAILRMLTEYSISASPTRPLAGTRSSDLTRHPGPLPTSSFWAEPWARLPSSSPSPTACCSSPTPPPMEH